jgi:uncharacterized protein (DUF885 family)
VSLRACGLFCLAVALGCAHPGAGARDLSVDALADEATSLVYSLEPCRATTDGRHEHDGELPDYSPAAVSAGVARWDAFLKKTEALSPSALSLDDQVDLEVLRGIANNARFERAERRSFQQNPMVYIQSAGDCVDSLMKRDFAPARERLRRVSERLGRIPALLAQGQANVVNPPQEFADIALREATGAIPFFKDSVARWAREAAGGDAALLEQFDAANQKAVAAVTAYEAWVKELRSKAHGSYALGTELFMKKLKYAEGIDLPLDQLLARGEAQLRKDREAFLATAQSIKPHKPPADAVKSLGMDHPKESELLDFVRSTLDKTRGFVVSHRLATIPSEVMPKVMETPPYLRAGNFASMDSPGAYETKTREAYYYVTPVEAAWTPAHKEEHLRGFNRPETEVVTIHEAFPGHFLQLLYNPTLPTKARRLADSNTNVEGWAHYSEQMMVDQGFGEGDPRVRLAQLSEALLRDCRYVASIKLHTKGMTVAQAQKLFEEQCFQLPSFAFEEARRGTYDAIYLYYTYGKLEIQELAKDYLLTKSGDLRAFHDAFVRQGALPVPLVRKLLLH